MHVVFRLDASRTIGLGHLSRTSNLALALDERGVGSTFLVGGEGGAGLARARLPARTEVQPIAETGSEGDLEATIGYAERVRASWVLVDHYELDASFLRSLRARVARLCVLDDLADRDLVMADLVVNSTPAAAMVEYPPALQPRLLAGDFVLLHPAFAAHRKPPPYRAGRPARVLVSFGGTDAASILPAALRQVARRFPEAQIRVILGVTETKEAPAFGESRYYAQPPEAMAAHMAWADLAIATPSTISWELAAVGTPSVLCRVFENQDPTARYFRRLGAFPVIDGIGGLDEALGFYERLPLEDLTRRALLFASCCDGLGASRVAERLASGER
jgi:UDP-2,4-diacetamido-2,4,6-trideoxy-beta-L-altropyranose hydrolase